MKPLVVLVAQRSPRGGIEFDGHSSRDECQHAYRYIYHTFCLAGQMPALTTTCAKGSKFGERAGRAGFIDFLRDIAVHN